jgi:hypothetical protein
MKRTKTVSGEYKHRPFCHCGRDADVETLQRELAEAREECERLKTKLITEDDKLCGVNAKLRHDLERYSYALRLIRAHCTPVKSFAGRTARAALKGEE